jgi:hypothetical protein
MFRRRRPHVARGSAARDQAEDDQNARLAYLEQEAVIAQPVPVPAGPAPTAPAPAASMPDQLDQLAALHRQGTLSDDEFTTAKARLLSS